MCRLEEFSPRSKGRSNIKWSYYTLSGRGSLSYGQTFLRFRGGVRILSIEGWQNFCEPSDLEDALNAERVLHPRPPSPNVTLHKHCFAKHLAASPPATQWSSSSPCGGHTDDTMGRRPNALVLENFVRGQKRNDSSNRYAQTCKHCGEHFVRGRSESLFIHITKKCPAISEAERIQACITHSGGGSRIPPREVFERRPDDRRAAQARDSTAGQAADRNWSALETLAEASRQVDMSEKGGTGTGRDGAAAANPTNPAASGSGTGRLELREQFTLDNPPRPNGRRNGQSGEPWLPSSPVAAPTSRAEAADIAALTNEERLEALIQRHLAATEDSALNADAGASAPTQDESAISVAAAAAARLHPSVLDPQLGVGNVATMRSFETLTNQAAIEAIEATTAALAEAMDAGAWGDGTYRESRIPPPRPPTPPPPPCPSVHRKGGTRIDTDAKSDGRPKHARARFNPLRRKEVQEVRRMGACSRCRILRKTCDNKSPCSACEKVINPRVWNAGCIRDRLIDHVEIWSAGIQVVLNQTRTKRLLQDSLTTYHNSRIDASLVYDLAECISCPVFVGFPKRATMESTGSAPVRELQVIAIDTDRIDLPQAVEDHTRRFMPFLIQQEDSQFVKVLLRNAAEQLDQEDDKLLRWALDLWGLTEVIEREGLWNIVKKGDVKDGQPNWLEKAPMGEQNVFTNLSGQLSAAAERRARVTSDNLLKHMHRDLHDSKVKITFKTYLAGMLLLNSIERYVWLFRAYDQELVRKSWPLADKDPRSFYQNVGRVAENLKTLFSMRKALPATDIGPGGKVIAPEADAVLQKFFEDINLDCKSDYIVQSHVRFHPNT